MGAYFERRSKRKNIPLTFHFEWAVQIFELICDEHAIQRDVLRQVMMSYTAILIDVQNSGHIHCGTRSRMRSVCFCSDRKPYFQGAYR